MATTDSTNKFDFNEEAAVRAKEETPQLSMLYKVLKTIAIILVWIAIGLWSEVNGATLPDLMFRTNTRFEMISLAISMRGAGGLTASFLGGGAFVDRFHSKAELILAVSVVLCSGLNVVVAYSRWVELLFAVFFLEGILEVLVNIAGQVIIMDTWMERASGPLHLIHLGYGAGSFLVPQIVAPFISNVIPANEDDIVNPACGAAVTSVNQTLNSTLISTYSSTTAAPLPSDDVVYGFWIVSGLIVLISTLWFGYHFFDKKKTVAAVEVKDKTSLKEIYNPNTCVPGHPVYALALYALMFLWIYTAVAGERIFAKYLFSFARNEACFEKQEATNILSAYWISFTLGRFAGFIGAIFIPMKFMIFIEGIGSLASALVLFFFGANKLVLWSCVCISGFLIGPCYPSGLAWADRYMIVTATGVTVLSIAAGVSDLSFLPIVGSFIDSMGIGVMTSFVLSFGVAICALPIAMTLVGRIRGDRFERESEENEEVEYEEETEASSRPE